MEKFDDLRLHFKSIQHATNNFAVGNFIAEGGFGKVYRGEFYSKGLGAVKCIDRSKDQADVSFWREIMLLSTYRHENLVSLIGFCDEGEQRVLVYEYAHNKSLDFYLHDPNLRWIQRLKICLGAACGLEYLHNPRGSQQRVLHRDIKSANILLDKDWNAKIADFGLSKYGPANQQHTFLFSDAKGTLGYCDPMYIETMLLTKESDVYSFGVVLFEVLCSRPCVDYSYNDHRRSLPLFVKNCEQEQHKLNMIIDDSLRQQIDEIAFDTFVAVAYQCLKRDRALRPAMELVVNKLKSALEYQEIFEDKAQNARSRPRETVGEGAKLRANHSQPNAELDPEKAKAKAIAKAESKAKGKAIAKSIAIARANGNSKANIDSIIHTMDLGSPPRKNQKIFEVKAQEAKSKPIETVEVGAKSMFTQSEEQIEQETWRKPEREFDLVKSDSITKAESKAKGKAIAKNIAIARANGNPKANYDSISRAMDLDSHPPKNKDIKVKAQEAKSRERKTPSVGANSMFAPSQRQIEQEARQKEVKAQEAKSKERKTPSMGGNSMFVQSGRQIEQETWKSQAITKADSKAKGKAIAKSLAAARAKGNPNAYYDSATDTIHKGSRSYKNKMTASMNWIRDRLNIN